MDPNAFLMGAAVPSMRWDAPGVRLSGRVVHRETRLQTVFGTGEVKKWPSGDPMYQLVVHVQTTWRDPSIENDNGVRAVYIKGKLFTDAVRDAVRAAGAPGVEVGGMIEIVYTGDDMTSKAPIKPKMYQVRYQAAPPQYQDHQSGGYIPPGTYANLPPAPPGGGWGAPSQSTAYPTQVPYQQDGQWASQQPRQQPGPPVYLQHTPAAHHEQGPPPEWAQPAPAPVADPAPTMSTLAHIRANRDAPTSGQPFGDVEPAF
jgi:hypothetical protein